MKKNDNTQRPGQYIWTKTIRLRTGRVLRAEDYGKKAFRILVNK